MAINFLNAVSIAGNLDLNVNQLVQVRIENLTSNPAGTGGRIYYNSTDGSLRYYNGDSTSWITLDGTGDVDSIAVANGGTSSGTALSVNSSTGSVTISSLAYGGTTNVGHVPTGGGASTFLRGDGTWATPGGTYSSWTLGADAASGTNTVSDGQTATFTGGTGIDTSLSTRTVTFSLDLNELSTVTAVATDFVAIVDATDNSSKKALISDIVALVPQGDVTAVTASTTNAKKGITVANSTGPVPDVGLDIIGQTNLGATPAQTDELIIYDLSTTTNKSITVANLLAAAPQGDITGLTEGTGISITNATGPVPTITNSGVTSIVAGTNITISGSTGAVTINADTQGDLTGLTEGAGITITNATGPVPTIAIDYAGADNIILEATDDTGNAVAATDKIITSNVSTNAVEYHNVSDLPFTSNVGDITNVSAGTYLNGGGGSGSVTLNHDTTNRSDTTTSASPGSGGTVDIVDSVSTNATGHVTAINVETVTFPTSDNYSSWTVSDSSNTSTVGSGQTVTFEGTANQITIGESSRTVSFALTTNVTVAGDLTVSGGDISLGGTGRITGIDTVTASTDAASKSYVDSAVSGQLVFQGGYDASGDPPSGAGVLTGYTYVVTVAGSGSGGTFWSVPLEIGDLIISNQDNPVDEGDWTEVNKNISLATTTTVGVASFSSDNFAVSAAGAVTIKNNGVILGTETTGNYTATVAQSSANALKGISVSGATGEGQAAVVGLDIDGQTGLTTPSTADELLIHDAANDTNKKITYGNLLAGMVNDNSFAGTFPSTNSSSFTVAHGLSSTDLIVQVFRISDGATVFAQVERTSSSLVTITCSSTQTASTLRVLCTKCV